VVLARVIKQVKEINGIGQEGVKISLITENMDFIY
jgi:hypothetical protein